MADATFNVRIDMQTFAGYDFWKSFNSGMVWTPSYTTCWGSSNDGFYNTIKGTNLDWGGPNGLFPDMGAVTDWEFGHTQVITFASDPFKPVIETTIYWSLTGLSITAYELRSAAGNDGATLAASMATILAGNDTVSGSGYDDYLIGYDGNDSLYGNGGNDTLDGGAGSDVLNGGLGADTLFGSIGNDTYIVDNVGDRVVEGSTAGGADLVKASISFTLPKNIEKLTLTGIDKINGTGNSLANAIIGNAAANILKGFSGADNLSGGDGVDQLFGGAGNDKLTGGGGADLFSFDTLLNGSANVDQISDFSVVDDTIQLDDDIFTAIGPVGTLGPDAFFAGNAAHDADDRVMYDNATGNIYYDADGSGAGAQVLFAHVYAGLGLTNADFLIVG